MKGLHETGHFDIVGEAACPATQVVELPMHSDRRFVEAALAAGVSGYRLKDISTRTAARSCRRPTPAQSPASSATPCERE